MDKVGVPAPIEELTAEERDWLRQHRNDSNDLIAVRDK